MKTNTSLTLEEWAEIFRYFYQVERVTVDSSSELLNISIRGQEEVIQASIVDIDNSLNKFNYNPHEVVTDFLKKHGILVYYQDTLVGFFDIRAYSTFVDKTSAEEAITKVSNLLSQIRRLSNTDILSVKLNHWIISDSIILVVDTNHHPLFSGSLECFLETCSMIMRDSIKAGLPLRGAIGAGYFYKDGELMVSSGLVDAAHYEKEQNWLGAVLTPKAFQIVQKTKELEISRKGETNIDFSSDRFNSFIKYGIIPWKVSGKKDIEMPHEAFYIKPDLADKEWASKYLPSYFDDQSIINNSHCLYAEN